MTLKPLTADVFCEKILDCGKIYCLIIYYGILPIWLQWESADGTVTHSDKTYFYSCAKLATSLNKFCIAAHLLVKCPWPKARHWLPTSPIKPKKTLETDLAFENYSNS